MSESELVDLLPPPTTMPPRRRRAAAESSSKNEEGAMATTRNLPSTAEAPSSSNIPAAKRRTSARNMTSPPHSDEAINTAAAPPAKNKSSKRPTKKCRTNQHDDVEDPSIDTSAAGTIEVQASSPVKSKKKRSADHDLPQSADGTVILPPPTKRLKTAPPPSPSPPTAATATTGTKRPRPRPKPAAAKSSSGGGSTSKDATLASGLQHAQVIGKRKDRLSDIVEDEEHGHEHEDEDEFIPQTEKPNGGFIAGLASSNGGDDGFITGSDISDEDGELIPGLAELEGFESDLVGSDIELGASPVKVSPNLSLIDTNLPDILEKR